MNILNAAPFEALCPKCPNDKMTKVAKSWPKVVKNLHKETDIVTSWAAGQLKTGYMAWGYSIHYSLGTTQQEFETPIKSIVAENLDHYFVIQYKTNVIMSLFYFISDRGKIIYTTHRIDRKYYLRFICSLSLFLKERR